MKLALNVQGIDKALKALAKAEAKIATKALTKGLRDGAKIVLAEEKSAIPTVTGGVKSKLKVRRGKRDRSKNKVIRFKVVTSAPPLKEGETNPQDAFYYSYVEFGSKYIKRRNYAQRAAKRVEGQVIEAISQQIRTAL